MAQSLNALAVGALVKDTGTLYNGKPIIWKIADKGHTGYPSGAVTLITERIISLKCFDAIESGNSDGDRRSYGNNRWTLSNLRQWLNSQAAAGKWYSAQHGADAAPTNANVWSNYNEYDAEAGFLAGFSANFIAALLTTTHTVGKATVDGGGTESCADKIFLATCTEVGLSGDVTAGSKLALFSNDSSRLAYPTAEAVSKSEYTNGSFNVNSPWYWWLADAYASYSYGVRDVRSSGAVLWSNACNGDRGVRPLCNLSSGILVSDSPDSDGAYTIIWNRAPSKPSSITVPSNVRGGESLSISWGASTDEDGNLSGYILERQVNGGAWAQVYKGINRSYTDAITFGWTSIAYRVKAYDSAGAEEKQHQRDADGGKQPCARYQRHRFQLGSEDRRVRAELQRNGRRQRADLDRDGVHRRHAEALLHRDKRTELFVQHHRRRVGEAVERVPYAENRCGGQLRRKRDPDVYVHEK